jgi:DNA-directed RNA polymerase subunit M
MPNDETTNKVEAKKNRAFKYCPKCGSTDVFWAQGMPQFWSLWQCRQCGYRGAFILEDGNLALKLQEEWKKRVTP